MNEFIVWDNKFKKFVSDNDDTGREFFVNCDGKVFLKTIGMETFGGNIQLEWEINRFKQFPHIGKTDINGKKIYAESSILRINHFIDNKGKQHYVYRKVSWSEKYSAWVVKTLDDKEEWLYYVVERNAKNLEIIDTIQENKLGLIK